MLGRLVRAAGGTSIFTNEIAALGQSGGLAFGDKIEQVTGMLGWSALSSGSGDPTE